MLISVLVAGFFEDLDKEQEEAGIHSAFASLSMDESEGESAVSAKPTPRFFLANGLKME